MGNSHIMLMVGVLVLFSVIGISCGLIVHDHCPPHTKDVDAVKTSFVLMIMSLVFVISFVFIYVYIQTLHTHTAIDVHHTTHMGHSNMGHSNMGHSHMGYSNTGHSPRRYRGRGT